MKSVADHDHLLHPCHSRNNAVAHGRLIAAQGVCKPFANISDFWAYLIPMAVFMGCIWVGSNWKSLYPLSYVLRTLLVAVALWLLWPKYTKVRWNHWWLGVIVGIIGIVQWVGMEKLLMSQDWLFWMRMTRHQGQRVRSARAFFHLLQRRGVSSRSAGPARCWWCR